MRTSGASGASLVEANILVELPSLLYVDAGKPNSRLTAWGKNSAIKLSKTWPLIAALGKKNMSNFLSSMTHLDSHPDKFSFIKTLVIARAHGYYAKKN